MNEKNLFEMIGTLDDRYVLEAVPENRIKMTKGGRRFSAAMIAAVVAASALTVGTAAAVITSAVHKESISVFYGDDLESKGCAVGNVTENGHFRITVDSYVRDAYRGRPVITVEALDDAADAYLSRENFLSATLTYADSGEPAGIINGWLGRVDYESGKPLPLCGELIHKEGNRTIDLTRPLTATFTPYVLATPEEEHLTDGLTLDLPQITSVKDAVLYSADGTEAYISELGIVAMVPILDAETHRYGLRYKDGTVIDDIWWSQLCSDGSGLFINNEDIGDMINFRTLVDPDEIDALIIDGEEFTRR